MPPEAVDQSLLELSARRTLCECKGKAEYFHIKGPKGLIRDALVTMMPSKARGQPVSNGD
ncbi:DUF427 domain-containing protein [Thiorhodovibrio frisius]|uniref:DUF427 domain-containing protein n=1 Tax=Thiorhodovibrio frisius TaxID=631362 RepID=UPI000255E9C0|nr:DUF427 domain-containing protein [Thiorhodovibrio frisius]